MSGLESRLQSVDGVDGIELELGEDGLEGITVRLSEGADEVAVLEGVRRLLVAYGTKAPREAHSATHSSPDESLVEGEAVVDDPQFFEASPESPDDASTEDSEDEMPKDSAEPRVATAVTADGHKIWLAVEPGADRSTALISISIDDRGTRRQVPASPRAIVQSVIDAGAELSARAPISVIGINVSTIEGTRILTVIVGGHGSLPRVCTASVVASDWPAALLDVLCQVLEAARVP